MCHPTERNSSFELIDRSWTVLYGGFSGFIDTFVLLRAQSVICGSFRCVWDLFMYSERNESLENKIDSSLDSCIMH